MTAQPGLDDACVHDEVEQLYRSEREPLLGFVIRLAYRHGLADPYRAAEDVVQATFVAALQQWSQLRQPQAWLYVVARRLTIREASQTARFGLAADVAAVDQTGRGGWSSTTRRASVEDVVAARDVVDAIARLAGRKKIVTYLRHVQGWDPAEVADFLGCARSTVNVHAHRGIAALTAMLGTGLLTALTWAAAAIGHLFQREPVLSTRQKRAGFMVVAAFVLCTAFSPGPTASFLQRLGDLSADVAREVGTACEDRLSRP